MSEQENRDTLERFFETFERQDIGAFTELFHDDYVEEYPSRVRGFAASRTGAASSRTIRGCRA